MSKPLRIAIDGNEANVLQRVGSNAYAYELLCELERVLNARKDVNVVVLLSAPANDQMPKEHKGWVYRVVGPAPMWTQFALPIYLFLHQKEFDVFYTPGHYAPRVSSVPYISSVMDLAFLYFPKQFRRKDLVQLKEWTGYSVKHAQKVIAISEFTKKDVMKSYHLPDQKVVVAYPGIDATNLPQHKEKEKQHILRKWQIRQPYVLYVGTLQPRKNLLQLIEAFEKLKSPMQLVIAGKTGWLAQPIMDRVNASPVKKKIIMTGYVSETEKQVLLQNAVATVLIGLYEGFGIPPLEAMAYGSIPIVSETTSLPEVVGDAGILVNPESSDELAAAMMEVFHFSAKDRAKFLKKGRIQVKKFSWQKSAEIVLETIEKIVQKGR